jgi:hypothetical protein
MKRMLLVVAAAAILICFTGCAQHVTHEVHTQQSIEKVESQEIVVK